MKTSGWCALDETSEEKKRVSTRSVVFCFVHRWLPHATRPFHTQHFVSCCCRLREIKRQREKEFAEWINIRTQNTESETWDWQEAMHRGLNKTVCCCLSLRTYEKQVRKPRLMNEICHNVHPRLRYWLPVGERRFVYKCESYGFGERRWLMSAITLEIFPGI